MKKIRLRFAPSPTGYLHIGSLRTVLFNYLIAKSLNGRLILRIEDTDQKREVKGAVEKLIEILNWIGIEFDEGPGSVGTFGPYIQSQRLNLYKKYVKQLLIKGEAYRCFCSPERLDEMRKHQQTQKLAPRYDQACRDFRDEQVKRLLTLNNKFVIRQKMPLEGEVTVKDELRGQIKFKAEDLEDHILIKSNGMPTYQFASVVDDHLMEISHVLRGEEWIPSFPKNVLLYKSFGWQLPKFIHLPLTLNKEGGKLSKRQGDVAVEDYRALGYIAKALINFSILLGWHPKGDNEILSSEEAIKVFNIKDMTISPAIFDTNKLDYLNGYYIRKENLDDLTKLCLPFLKKYWQDKKANNRFLEFLSAHNNDHGKDYIKKVVGLEQERLKKLSEIGELTEFFFITELKYPAELLIWKKMTKSKVKKNLKQIYEQIEKIPEKNWTNDSIEEGIINYLQLKNLKVGEYLWPMRVALTGRQASPGPFDVAEILGKKESLKRINEGISIIS